jgi:pyruvate carboxylase
VFIEMNPRIQVEHKVTEETTDVDLVRTQLLVAEGARLHELGLTQDRIHQRSFALRCRITTEDPSAGFRPEPARSPPIARRAARGSSSCSDPGLAPCRGSWGPSGR